MSGLHNSQSVRGDTGYQVNDVSYLIVQHGGYNGVSLSASLTYIQSIEFAAFLVVWKATTSTTVVVYDTINNTTVVVR